MRALTHLRRAAAAAALLAAASTAIAGPAQADGDLAPLPDRALDAAVTAARSDAATDLVRASTRSAAQRAGVAPRGQVRPEIARRGVPVYGLSAGFVTGTSSAPGTLWYVAIPASARGQQVTVFTAKVKRRWVAVNVATGDTEARMAKKAGPGRLLTEPQVDAWYAVRNGRVRPLNAAARSVVGSKAVPVAAYQRIVHRRYGDKLAGSGYDAQGAAGGYDATAVAERTPVGGSLPVDTSGHDTTSGPLTGLALGLSAVAGAAIVLRRRSRRTA